jgi:hypothetical protein
LARNVAPHNELAIALRVALALPGRIFLKHESDRLRDNTKDLGLWTQAVFALSGRRAAGLMKVTRKTLRYPGYASGIEG